MLEKIEAKSVSRDRFIAERSLIQFACWCYSNESRKSNEPNPKDGFALDSIGRMVMAKKSHFEKDSKWLHLGKLFLNVATVAQR